jgi:TorA maturation chaperone TorD
MMKPVKREMRSEISRFINKHILSWVPQWQKDVKAQAGHNSTRVLQNLYMPVQKILQHYPGITDQKSGLNKAFIAPI